MADKRTFRDGGDDTMQRRRPARAYDGRRRFYGALLLFIIIVGLPMVMVPSLRSRLAARISAFRDAISGQSGPLVAEMGKEQKPFPEEFERPESTFPGPESPLPMDRVFTESSGERKPQTGAPPALMTPESADAEVERSIAEPDAPSADSEAAGSENGLDYAQGEVEQEAYGMLLESYPEVGEMIKDGDASMRFLSWGAVKRGEELYWVRLVFQTEENPEVEYIWQVELESGRVLPLSHNARTIT